jgi:hypothetical protein
MTDNGKATPEGKLFALDYDGKRYQAAFMRRNGAGKIEPVFEDVTCYDFYKLAADYTEFVDSFDIGTGERSIYQKYDIEAQIQAAHEAEMAELDDERQTMDDAANRAGYG